MKAKRLIKLILLEESVCTLSVFPWMHILRVLSSTRKRKGHTKNISAKRNLICGLCNIWCEIFTYSQLPNFQNHRNEIDTDHSPHCLYILVRLIQENMLANNDVKNITKYTFSCVSDDFSFCFDMSFHKVCFFVDSCKSLLFLQKVFYF